MNHPSVVFRTGRPTAKDYDEAIQTLLEAKTQLQPDGHNCSVCGDGSHQAFECHHNPLVMARRAAFAYGHEGSALPWRCFHCGMVFTDPADALEHFGEKSQPLPKCEQEQKGA